MLGAQGRLLEEFLLKTGSASQTARSRGTSCWVVQIDIPAVAGHDPSCLQDENTWSNILWFKILYIYLYGNQNTETMSREFIELQREQLIGRRVKCILMPDDPNPIEKGSVGTIDYIDDAGHIHVKWDNGRSLSLIPNVDFYEVLDRSCQNGLYRECALFYHNNCKGCPMFK
jgi:hypothetical protein